MAIPKSNWKVTTIFNWRYTIMMKKTSVSILSLIFIFHISFPSFVAAEDSLIETTNNMLLDEEYIESELENAIPTDEANASVEGLLSEWEMNGYPDNVGSVYYDSNSEKYVISLVNNDEAHRDEIRALLSDPDFQDFETATYSYNDLLAVQHKIEKDMMEQTDVAQNISWVGVGWATIDGEVVGFGASGKEFRVVVGVPESSFTEYSEKYETLYGDMVYTEIGNAGIGIPSEDASDGVETMIKQDDNNIWLYTAVFTMLCIGLLATVFIKRNGFVSVKQTTNGEIETNSNSLRRNEVVSAVKESTIEPGDNVYHAIKQEIEKK